MCPFPTACFAFQNINLFKFQLFFQQFITEIMSSRINTEWKRTRKKGWCLYVHFSPLQVTDKRTNEQTLRQTHHYCHAKSFKLKVICIWRKFMQGYILQGMPEEISWALLFPFDFLLETVCARVHKYTCMYLRMWYSALFDLWRVINNFSCKRSNDTDYEIISINIFIWWTIDLRKLLFNVSFISDATVCVCVCFKLCNWWAINQTLQKIRFFKISQESSAQTWVLLFKPQRKL